MQEPREGRLLCEFLSEKNIKACVCVTTSYGEQLLPSGENMEICTGALDRAQMEEKLSSFRPQLVIDATHPYARLATENIRAACGFLNLPYIRVVRESCGKEKNGAETAVVAGETAGPEKNAEPEKTTGLTKTAGPGKNAWPEITDITQKIGGQEESRLLTEADSMEEAAKLLEKMEGNILVTTGSKELEALRGLPGFSKRIFARILPQPEMMQKCMEMGLPGRHIICMQGPFSEEMNYAMLRETNARILLTKESGAAGGFPEKLRGAKRAGAAVVVVKRPVEEEGCSVEEVKALLQNGGRDTGSDGRPYNSQALLSGDTSAAVQIDGGNTVPCLRQNISILGIGMGSADSMTEGVKKLLSRAGLVAGAGRMLDALRTYGGNGGRQAGSLCLGAGHHLPGNRGERGSTDGCADVGRQRFLQRDEEASAGIGGLPGTDERPAGGHNPCGARNFLPVLFRIQTADLLGGCKDFKLPWERRESSGRCSRPPENLCPDGRADRGNLRRADGRRPGRYPGV